MTDTLQEIKDRADRFYLECTDCGHLIQFDDFLDTYPHRIDEEGGSIEMGCVECGHPTVKVLPERAVERDVEVGPRTFVVNGLEEFNELVER